MSLNKRANGHAADAPVRKLTALAVSALILTACQSDPTGIVGGDSVDLEEATLISQYDPNEALPSDAAEGNIAAWSRIDFKRDETLALQASAGSGYLRLDDLSNYLNAVMDRIVAAGPVPEVPVEVYVLDVRIPNAFASPDGAILVTMGMLRNLRSEDELAALLAHELAHVLYQHGRADWWLDAQKQLISVQALASDVFTDVKGEQAEEAESDIDRLTVMSQAAHFMSETTLAPVYTRDQEDQADLMAVDLLDRAGYQHEAMSDVVNILASAQAQLRERRRLSEKRMVQALQTSLGVEDERIKTGVSEASNAVLDAWRTVFGENHRPPEERRKRLGDYLFYHYDTRARSATVLPWADNTPQNARASDLVQASQGETLARIFDNYRLAEEADTELAAGKLDTAEQLVRQAVSGPTQYAPYPRLTFYEVRNKQGREDLAWRNLEIGMEGKQPSVIIYQKAIERAAQSGRIDTAMEISNAAQERLNDPVTLWPWRIWLLTQTGQEREAIELQSKCRLRFPGELEDACRYGPNGRDEEEAAAL